MVHNDRRRHGDTREGARRKSVAVEEGGDGQDRVVAHGRSGPGMDLRGVGNQVAMAEHDRLGMARRTACRQQKRRFIERPSAAGKTRNRDPNEAKFFRRSTTTLRPCRRPGAAEKPPLPGEPIERLLPAGQPVLQQMV